MSYSGFVTGWIERRLPFLVTTMFSRPLVDLRVSSETVPGNRSSKATSTVYQVGDSLLLPSS